MRVLEPLIAISILGMFFNPTVQMRGHCDQSNPAEETLKNVKI